MIYVLNAVAFAWIASFWSKSGLANMVVALLFTLLALANCVLAYPFVEHLVKP